ncbi:hypothetical protein F5Y19DRAFT_459428 [Xylariaceae sp. FL1651]|nr:hypothetical protein F5Y19DRAFT_459428 [Xylariaceae sp. FL1651]
MSSYSGPWDNPSRRGTASSSSHETASSSRRSYHSNGQTITSIPGRYIHPSKLENMLQARFGGNYSVAMRDDNYKVSATSKISYADIKKCY